MATPTRGELDRGELESCPSAAPAVSDPDIDLSSYVLTAVDAHLAALHALRDQLGMSRAVGPGDRRAVAARSVVAARRYADEMSRALGIAT